MEKIMEDIKRYFTKASYSLYMGLIMGFFITSGFFVIITNIDRYFFNDSIGISGDLFYFIGTLFLIPILGALFVYNKRIVIKSNHLEIRQSSLFFIVSRIDVSDIKGISLYQEKRRKYIKKGIVFENENSFLMTYIKPFSHKTLSMLLKDLLSINPDIKVDDYFNNIIKTN
jgi:hypothetical protein